MDRLFVLADISNESGAIKRMAQFSLSQFIKLSINQCRPILLDSIPVILSMLGAGFHYFENE